MNIRLLGIAVLFVLATAGCASAQPSKSESAGAGLRLDELVVLSGQGLSDEALIAQIEQRGVAFVLSPQDFEQQRAAGVSDGVLRYLQGRASGEQALKGRIVSGLYRVPAYSGGFYLGSRTSAITAGSTTTAHQYYGGRGGHASAHYGSYHGGHH